MYRNFIKRLLDIVGAITGLVAFTPLIAVVALFVRARLGKPVLFRQTRPGRAGKPFDILKFRTMRPPQGEESDAERLTSFGHLLRALSVDELPELWNVFRGDMSLVGPRPLRMEYLGRYTPEQARRHEVRPGITGLAQINGRNTLDWEAKFRLDVEYVDSVSFLQDTRILLTTIAIVLRRSGINRQGHATAPEFLGSTTQRSQ